MINEDFVSALKQLAAERKIDSSGILKAISEAIIQNYVRDKGLNRENLEVEIDQDKGSITVWLIKEVVDKVEDPKTQVTLSEAKKFYQKAKKGAKLKFDVTPEGDFGRIAAQSARNVIRQKIKEAEREAALSIVSQRIGTIATVQVEKVLPNGDVVCEISGLKAVLPKEERIPNEFYKIGSQIKVGLVEVVEDADQNKYLRLCRASELFLKYVLELEVPEIASGTVEVVSIAREPGVRSKVAVKSNSPGVDPRGACIGQRGVRINAIMDALKAQDGEERVDVIKWEEDPVAYISSAVQPAFARKVEIIDEKVKKARVLVDSDKLSLAIGRDGLNAKLVRKLTGWDIEVAAIDGDENK